MEMNGKNKWILILLAGILLVVIAMPTGKIPGSEDEETKLETILGEMEGVGKVKVMTTEEGVVVIADGADNWTVVQNITDVVQALFNVDSHKIKVMKGNQND